MKNKKVTKDTTLKEILEISGAKEVLEKYKISCLFCPLVELEMGNLKIEKICQFYGIDLEEFLKELNFSIKNFDPKKENLK